MKTKEEVLSALIARRALIRYVTSKELLRDPVLRNMKPKTLGVRLLRLKREGLVTRGKLGRAYAYRLTIRGLKRRDYLYDKRRIVEEKIEQFKRRFDQEYNKLIFQKLLEAAKEDQQ